MTSSAVKNILEAGEWTDKRCLTQASASSTLLTACKGVNGEGDRNKPLGTLECPSLSISWELDAMGFLEVTVLSGSSSGCVMVGVPESSHECSYCYCWVKSIILLFIFSVSPLCSSFLVLFRLIKPFSVFHFIFTNDSSYTSLFIVLVVALWN